MSEAEHRQLDRELNEGSDMEFDDGEGALPPAYDAIIPEPAPPAANPLGEALRRGVDVMNANRRQRDNELVNFDSSDEEHEDPVAQPEPIDVGRQSEAHRRATQVSAIRAEQDLIKVELATGCAPLRFAEILPRFDTIRNQCLRDAVANRYVERVQHVAKCLATINESLQSELDPVSTEQYIITK